MVVLINTNMFFLLSVNEHSIIEISKSCLPNVSYAIISHLSEDSDCLGNSWSFGFICDIGNVLSGFIKMTVSPLAIKWKHKSGIVYFIILKLACRFLIFQSFVFKDITSKDFLGVFRSITSQEHEDLCFCQDCFCQVLFETFYL